MDDATWAVEEFAAADLGDRRRTARLLDLASAVARLPTASLPQACVDEAQLDAAYRFFANDHIAPAAILDSHVQATLARAASQPRILAVQDTCLLDFTHHPATTGLGPLASPAHQGLLLHSTLAFTPERLPLGLLAQQRWTRDPATVGKSAQRHDLPIADKESYKWLRSLQAVNSAALACPATHFVSIGDREADIYDLFVTAREANVDLLVRATEDRRTTQPQGKLWATVAAAREQTTVHLAVPRPGTQPARPATLTVRWCPVTVRPPKNRAGAPLAVVNLWAVWAWEAGAPPGVEALEWLLLTTCAVTDAATARERLDWYAARWGIEVWHKVLKSGCRIEARQLATAGRLERALVVYSVVAWRLLYATLLARVVPEGPCSLLLEQEEWEALYCRMQQVAVPPGTAPSLRQAVRWLAQLGGFVGRAGDGEPGVTVLWRGWQRLGDLVAMYRIMRPVGGREVRSGPR